jgi:hypothetical protein
MTPAHVAICVPARDMVSAGFAFDLARLVGAADCDVSLLTSMGTLIVNQRTDLAKDAIKMGASHILYLDSDMRFPKDTLARLLAHDQGIVAANYATRKFPIQPVTFATDTDNTRVYTNPESTGLESVAAAGMGVMLVKTEVFDKIGLPYFMIGYSPKNQDYTGEDIFFCRKARQAGFEVFIDHDLSKEIKHTGSLDFQHDHIWATQGAE